MKNNSTGNPKWIGDCAICGYALYEGITHSCGTAPKNITLKRYDIDEFIGILSDEDAKALKERIREGKDLFMRIWLKCLKKLIKG